jgi:hypothetical protein
MYDVKERITDRPTKLPHRPNGPDPHRSYPGAHGRHYFGRCPVQPYIGTIISTGPNE